jgi:hypothetical protein
MRVVIRRRLTQREANRTEHPIGHLAARTGLAVQWLAINCFAVCVWRWSFDLGLLQSFPAEAGLFARWQMWFAAGAILQIFALLLARCARNFQQSEAGGRLGRSLHRAA